LLKDDLHFAQGKWVVFTEEDRIDFRVPLGDQFFGRLDVGFGVRNLGDIDADLEGLRRGIPYRNCRKNRRDDSAKEGHDSGSLLQSS
jgi:hypothetical protein